MENLLDSTENKDIIFVNDVKELKNIKGLVNKRLCIIKTDFKDINKIKSFCKKYPELEVWLACKEISRKNILFGPQNLVQ